MKYDDLIKELKELEPQKSNTALLVLCYILSTIGLFVAIFLLRYALLWGVFLCALYAVWFKVLIAKSKINQRYYKIFNQIPQIKLDNIT